MQAIIPWHTGTSLGGQCGRREPTAIDTGRGASHVSEMGSPLRRPPCNLWHAPCHWRVRIDGEFYCAAAGLGDAMRWRCDVTWPGPGCNNFARAPGRDHSFVALLIPDPGAIISLHIIMHHTPCHVAALPCHHETANAIEAEACHAVVRRMLNTFSVLKYKYFLHSYALTPIINLTNETDCGGSTQEKSADALYFEMEEVNSAGCTE